MNTSSVIRPTFVPCFNLFRLRLQENLPSVHNLLINVTSSIHDSPIDSLVGEVRRSGFRVLEFLP